MDSSGFTTSAISDLGFALKRGGLLALATGALCALLDVAMRTAEWSAASAALGDWFLLAPLQGAASYRITMSLVSAVPSRGSLLRYLTAYFLVMAPLIAQDILEYSPYIQEHPGTPFMPLVVGLLFLWGFLIFFLPAWPVSQALSDRYVSPLRILSATNGHRLALLFTSLFVFTSVGLLFALVAIPAIDHDMPVYFLTTALVGLTTILFSASIGVTALRFAAIRDPSLSPASL